MPSFTSSVTIKRNLPDVWQTLVSYSNWADWFSVMGRRIERSNLLVDKRGKGDIVRCFLDEDNYADFEVLQESQKLTLRLLRVQSRHKETVQAHATFTLESRGQSTILQNTVEIRLDGMLSMAQPFLALKGKSVQRQNLESFKSFIESQ